MFAPFYKYFFLVVFLFTLTAITIESPEENVFDFSSAENDTTRISIAFAGDVMGHGPQIRAALNPDSSSYNYDTCFVLLKPFLEQMDIAIANLEVTLAGPPYIGYPQFSSPDELPIALKKAGFDALITANNHSADRGNQGINRTIEILDSFKFPHTGTFKDKGEREKNYPLILESKGIKISLLNYTYGTNGIVVKEPAIVNLIDTLQILKDIQKAKGQKTDLIIATLHWGIEYEREPNKEQKKLAQWLADNGVNAIVAMHPHVVQTFEYYYPNNDSSKKIPVYYSLGNFVSNQRERYKDGGIFAQLDIIKTKDTCYISDNSFLPVWVSKSTDPVVYTLIPPYSQNIFLEKNDSAKLVEFFEDTRKHLSNIKESKNPLK